MTHEKFQRFVEHTLRNTATETLSDLLVWLKANGVLTDAGHPYRAERGVAALAAAAWRYATYQMNDPTLADQIKFRYTKQNGRYPWE